MANYSGRRFRRCPRFPWRSRRGRANHFATFLIQPSDSGPCPIAVNKLRPVKRIGPEAQLSHSSVSKSIKKLKAQANFAKLGPLGRIDLLHCSHYPHRHITRFIEENTQINLLKKINCSWHSLEYAVRCYKAFCELSRRPDPLLQKMRLCG